MNIAIILAAGSGSRLNSKIPKAFLKINNKCIYQYSLDVFNSMKNIHKIVLVVPKEYKNNVVGGGKISIVVGGNNRINSIINAIDSCSDLNDEDIIITHDSARIFITNKMINNIIINTKKFNYSSLCSVCSDSIVYNWKNIDRNNIFFLQTPQSFKYNIWNKKKLNINGTDMFSCLNLKINKENLIINNENNLKVTYKKDILLSTFYLKS